MIETTQSTNYFPVEASIPPGAVSLEAILCTEELRRRPWRAPDHKKENRALVALAGALVESPFNILQTTVYAAYSNDFPVAWRRG